MRDLFSIRRIEEEIKMSDELEEIVVEQICGDCGKVRTNEPDYSGAQVILGQPLGWYSADDGEICPDDMVKTMSMANRGWHYTAWTDPNG